MIGRIWAVVVHDRHGEGSRTRVEATLGQARAFAETAATMGHDTELFSVRVEGEPTEVFARLATYGIGDDGPREFDVVITRRLAERFVPSTELVFPRGAWAYDHIRDIAEPAEEVDDD